MNPGQPRARRPRAARLAAGAIALLAMATAVGVSRPARADDPPQAPILRIEAGGHTGAVARLAVDGAGQLMASVSYDKTIRLWSLIDGKQRAVLRPPIGAREEGELYAVALTGDGKRVYAAGATGRSWDGAFDIYVFDVGRGAFVGMLGGLAAPINDLRVSPSGRRVAAGFAQGGVRVWDNPGGLPVEAFADTASYTGPVRGIAFDARDRLFTAAGDGRVRAYEPGGRKYADAAACGGQLPWGIAVSPDGGLVAVACQTADKQGRLRIDVLSARTLAPVFSPDTTGLAGEGLLAVSWVADGHGGVQLLAGGYANGANGYVLRRWGDFGLGAFDDVVAARDTIRDIVALPGGGAVYAAEDPGWGRIGGDGRIVQRPTPPLADLRPSRDRRLAVSGDGGVVEFATAAGISRFDVRAHTLAAVAKVDSKLAPARLDAPGLAVDGWRDGSQPRLNGRALALERGQFARALAIAPSGELVALGTDTSLRVYRRDGTLAGSADAPAQVRAVAFAESGSVVVAALLDGSIRWYAVAADGAPAERAALFAHADAIRWVLFTPEGFFDHADRGGNDLVGVHLNRARNQQPEWLSFSQAYRVLYAPKVVRARLLGEATPTEARLAELGDLRGRIARQPLVEIRAVCTKAADGSCAALDMRGGAARLAGPAEAAQLTVQVTDRGLGVGALDAFVNGRNAGRIAAPVAGKPITLDVPLDPGPVRVQLRVYDGGGAVFSESAPLSFERDAAAAPARDEPGRLFILAVGIDQYANPDLALRFAVADQRSLIDMLRRSAQPLFKSIEVISLVNAGATRTSILAAFDRLAVTVKPNDTFLFYVASHGVLDEENNRFLLVGNGANDISSFHAIAEQSIDEETLVGALSRVEARDALLLIDTCHSGKVTADNLANVGHETGRYMISASSSRQDALDSYDGHNGVFIVALREALAGRAGQDGDGNVGVLSLGEYVSRRVGQLARERQHQQDAVFRAAQRDLRSFAVARVAAKP